MERRLSVGWVSLLGITGILILFAAWAIFHNNTQPTKQQRHTTTSQPPKDTSPPHVTLSSLAPGQEVSNIITIRVNVSDDQAVAKVEYFVDSTFLGVSYSRPFSFQLDTTTLQNGHHSIVAKAYDTAGNIASSQTIDIIVNNTSAPQTASTTTTPSVATPRVATLSQAEVSSSPAHSNQQFDNSAPSVPAGVVLSADDGYTAKINWSTSTDNKGVTGYKIFRDGTQIGTSTSTTFNDETVVPGNTYSYAIAAYDAAGNISAHSLQPSITLVGTSIWINGDTPLAFATTDTSPVELGVKFRPLVDGKITGVRFYKAPGSNGTHIGNLWTTGGTKLASVTFGGETTSGWQEATFSTPVDVTAGSTYVVSYFAPQGVYGYTSGYFASQGITSQYLKVLPSTGADGSNGVYNASGSSAFPSSSFDNTNYWVDAMFAPNEGAGGPAPKVQDNSKIYTGYPGTNNTGVVVGKRLPKRDRAIDVYVANTTVENIELADSVNAKASNVTIRNVRVAPSTPVIWAFEQTSGNSGLTIEDSEAYGDGTHQLQYGLKDDGSNLTALRINLYHLTEGVQSNVNVLLQDSYIHDQIYFSGDHNGGFLSTGGDNIHIKHNTLQNPLNQTAVLALFCDFAPVTNVLAEENLLIGAGYSFYAPNCSGSGNIHVINNKFSREVWPNGGFNGPVALWNPTRPGDEWTGNTWLQDGTPVIP